MKTTATLNKVRKIALQLGHLTLGAAVLDAVCRGGEQVAHGIIGALGCHVDVGRKFHKIVVQLYEVAHHPHVCLRLAALLDQSVFCPFIIFQRLFDFLSHDVVFVSE